LKAVSHTALSGSFFRIAGPFAHPFFRLLFFFFPSLFSYGGLLSTFLGFDTAPSEILPPFMFCYRVAVDRHSFFCDFPGRLFPFFRFLVVWDGPAYKPNRPLRHCAVFFWKGASFPPFFRYYRFLFLFSFCCFFSLFGAEPFSTFRNSPEVKTAGNAPPRLTSHQTATRWGRQSANPAPPGRQRSFLSLACSNP